MNARRACILTALAVLVAMAGACNDRKPEPVRAPVLVPAPAPRHPATPTEAPGIACKDGSVSHAAHRRGVCSHHGGVQ